MYHLGMNNTAPPDGPVPPVPGVIATTTGLATLAAAAAVAATAGMMRLAEAPDFWAGIAIGIVGGPAVWFLTLLYRHQAAKMTASLRWHRAYRRWYRQTYTGRP